MDLLAFARGPALAFALLVFVLGTVWRLWAILRLPRQPDLSPPREGAPSPVVGALGAVVRGMWPRRGFGQAATVTTVNGYVFHVGLALVVFGYAPHIAFVRRLTGLHWPALPDALVALAAGATLLSLLLALWFRLSDPVRRLIADADDHISWTVTMLPMITGMALVGESSTALPLQGELLSRGALALHLLTLELLLIWFPFGKLMHALLFVFSRAATGIRFSHRGVRT